MAENLAATIQEVATGPKIGTVDGVTVQSQDLAQLIAADKYLAEKAVAAQPVRLGLRRTRLIPFGPS